MQPRTATQLNARLANSGIGTSVDLTTAQLVRGMSAMRSDGVYLLAGERVAAYAGWLLDGMSINGRMVVVLPERFDRAVVQPCFDVDLRISGHVQDIGSFFEDVSAHGFALVVVDCNDLLPDCAPSLLTDLVEAGGSVLALRPQTGSAERRAATATCSAMSEWFDQDWVITQLADGEMILAVRRAVPLNKRRGGRRALKHCR